MTSGAKVSMLSFQPQSFWKTGTYLSWAAPTFGAAHLLLPPSSAHHFIYPEDCRTAVWSHNCTQAGNTLVKDKIQPSYPTAYNSSKQLLKTGRRNDRAPRFRWHTTQMPATRLTKTDHLTWEWAAFRVADLHWPRAAWEFWMGTFQQHKNCSTLIIAESREALILSQGCKQTNQPSQDPSIIAAYGYMVVMICAGSKPKPQHLVK